MELIKRYRLIISCLLLLGVFYFGLRLPGLTRQPIFADEAIYIRWAQVMRSEPTLRFLPVSDGKTPLYMWILIPFFKVSSDPLLGARLLSVLSGFVTLMGVIFLSWKIFNVRAAVFAGFLMVVTPYIIFFDRMALVDSMLSAFGVWSVILSILVIQKMRLDLSFILGYLLGGSMLTKPPGFFNILMLPSTLTLFNWTPKGRELRLLKLAGLWIVSIITSYIIYNILRLGPGFSNLSSRNQDYLHSPLEILSHPLDPFIPHFKDLLSWIQTFWTIPTTFLIVSGLVLVVVKKQRAGMALALWAIVPILAQLALLQTLTARYLLPSMPLLLVLASFAADFFTKSKKFIWLGLVVLILAFTWPFNYWILVSPDKAPIPREERRGYFEDWTAGYGLKEIAEYLAVSAQSQDIVVGTEGSFGTLPDGLYIYLDKVKHLSLIGGGATISAQLKEAAKLHPTYFVANRSRYSETRGAADKLQLIKVYPKAIGPDLPPDAILLFKLPTLKP